MDTRTVVAILAALASAGAVYFFVNWVAQARELRGRTYVEARNAQIEVELRKERQGTKQQRVRRRLEGIGYYGDPAPLAVGVAFGYIVLAAAMSILGADAFTAVVVSLPVASIGTALVLRGSAKRRKARAGDQVAQLLRTVVTYLEAGASPAQAFTKATLLVDNPLRDDLSALLAARVGSDLLSKSLEPLGEKYPSQAMVLMLAALEVNDAVGAKLVPTLRQAERIVTQQAELAAEATAEVSQARSEFIGIASIIGGIGVLMLITGGEAARSAYLSPLGIVCILLGAANFAFGIWRTMKTMAKARSGNL